MHANEDPETAVVDDEQELERKTLARKEDQAVKWLRICVFVLLMLTATIVSVIAYRYVKNDQTADFEHEFNAMASKMTEAFQSTMALKIEGLEGLSAAFTSHALSSGSSWPNVTLPDFEIRAANTRVLTALTVINFHPLVKEEDRSGWEAYALQIRDEIFQTSCDSDDMQRAGQDSRFADNHDRQLQIMNRTGIYGLAPDGTQDYKPPGTGKDGRYLPST